MRCHLSEIIIIGNGKKRPNNVGKIPVYGGNGILGYCNEYNYDEKTIIIGRVGAYCGSVFLSHDKVWVTDNALAVKTKKSFDPTYIYYMLGKLNLNSFAQGSSHPLLTQTLINSIEVNCPPPLTEQKEIAEILSSLDDKIDLLHRQNKTLEEMAQTLFRQWFIEEAQDDWEEVELGEVVEVTTGKGLKKEEYDWEGMYPILGANGEIGRTDKFNFREKLILTGRVGTLGRVYFNNSKSWITDNVLIIKPHNNDIFYPIYFILKNLDYENLNAGSTQPLITQSDIKRIKIKIPNRKMCSVYASFFEVHFEKIQKNLPKIDIIIRLKTIISDFLLSKD